MNHWKHKKIPIFIWQYCFGLIFNYNLNYTLYFYYIFEDSSFSLPFAPPFFSRRNISKLGKQKSIWQITFKCFHSIMSTPENRYFIKSQIPRRDKELHMVHVLKELIFYLGRQGTFINKKNKINLKWVIRK